MNTTDTLLALEELVFTSTVPISIVEMWINDVKISYHLGWWTARWNGGTGMARSILDAIDTASRDSYDSIS